MHNRRRLQRVLYSAQLWTGSTCVPRLQGLKQKGLDVLSFDSSKWIDVGHRWKRSLVARTYTSPGVWRLNRNLVQVCLDFKPDVVWIDKGNWIYPSTLNILRKYTSYLIHYNTDDIFATVNHFWLHRLGIKKYDLYLTTNRHNVTEIPQYFGIPALRVGMGYDQDLAKPDHPNLVKQYDAVFVGHWEPNTEDHLKALLEKDVSVGVWGHNWRKAQSVALKRARPLSFEEYTNILPQAKIALCFLSRWNRNESTVRSFEIPAARTFMLAERTREHEFLYGDGIGVGLFSSPSELVAKTNHYLAHDKEREQVANCAHKRCMKLGLSWQEHIQREWIIVERVLGSGNEPLGPDDDMPFWEGYRMGKSWNHGTVGK